MGVSLRYLPLFITYRRNLMTLLSHSKTLLATLAMAAFASGAQADLVEVLPHKAGTTLYADVVNTTNNSYTGPAALWSVHNQTTDERFLAYCLEMLEGADQVSPQTYTSGAYNPTANVRELYDRYYSSVLQSPGNAVGFQLALWDLLGFADVDNFVTTIGATSIAQTMLDAVLGSSTGYTPDQYEYIRWTSDGFQDVLQVKAAGNVVSEPQTHTLMLGGLGLMVAGLASRRRKARKNR